MHFKLLDQYIGRFNIDQIHNGVLQPFIEKRLADGRKTRTINLALGAVRHMLNLAASEWFFLRANNELFGSVKHRLAELAPAKNPQGYF